MAEQRAAADKATEDASLAIAKAQAEAAELKATETVPGGSYVLEDGRTVDSSGKEIKSK